MKTSVGMLTKLSCELHACVCQTHADSSSGVTRTQRGMMWKTSVDKLKLLTKISLDTCTCTNGLHCGPVADFFILHPLISLEIFFIS